MSGAARFARSGRWRLFVCGGVIILLLTMLVIFHNQQELDEKRELRLRSLNDQLQSILEQKYDLEQNMENERIKQTNLEHKVNELKEFQSKDQLRYEKLLQSHKSLQAKDDELNIENEKIKKEQKEYANNMEKKLQDLRARKENEKIEELQNWKTKLDTALKEKKEIEILLNASNSKHERVIELEHLLNEYKIHCEYQPDTNKLQMYVNAPLQPPNTVHRHTNATLLHSEFDTHQVKSFNRQEQIIPKPLRKLSGEVNNKSNVQQQSMAVFPLSAPRKPTTTEGSKVAEKQVLGPVLVAVQKSTNSSSSTGSSLSPLQLPPNHQRKLPENVAPIPAYFDDLLKHDIANQKSTNKLKNSFTKKEKLNSADAGGDHDNAAEVGKNPDDKNNRYTNVVKDLDDNEHASHKAKKNVAEDSGAHEVKDHDANADHFNLPAEDGNFFAGDNDGIGAGEKVINAGPAVAGDDDDGIDQHRKDAADDDDMLGVGGADTGDIAVKNRNHLLDAAENLNNEVVGDQGKEFPVDELRLEDGNDEDGDEDDYSHIAARQQGAQAIRN